MTPSSRWIFCRVPIFQRGSVLTFYLFIFFEKGLMYSGLTITCCVTEDDFEALILLPPTPKCWDYKCAVYGFMQGWGSNLGFCIV